jgi:hypothetical protein
MQRLHPSPFRRCEYKETATKIGRHPLKFTPYEDALLISVVSQIGANDWNEIAAVVSSRTARQCRDRWMNYLSPELRTGNWTHEEDELLAKLVHDVGAKWKQLAGFFTRRSPNCLRNRWGQVTRHRAKSVFPPVPVTLEPIEQTHQSRNIIEELFPENALQDFKDDLAREYGSA